MTLTDIQHIGTDAREYTYFPIDNVVLDNYGLRAVELALYVAIVRFANRKTGAAFPGFATLAKASGMSEKSVERHIVTLETKGLIRIERLNGKSNHYIVLNPHKDGTEAALHHRLSDGGSPKITGKNPPTTDSLTVVDPTTTDRESVVDERTPVRESVVDKRTPDRESVVSTELPSESRYTTVRESGPQTESLSNNNVVVVVDSESDLDIHNQQQQQPPATVPAREPEPAEREVLKQARIAESLWRGWMQKHDAVTIVAAILHATEDKDIRNPVGLMRAMLEQGTATPNPKYVEKARERLGLADEDKAAYSKALEEAGWDPRFVERDEDGRWYATRRVGRTDSPALEPASRGNLNAKPGVSDNRYQIAVDWDATWAAVVERLRPRLVPSTFDAGLKVSQVGGYADGVLTVHTPGPDDTLTNLHHVIEQVLRDVAGQRVQVAFEPAPAAATVGGGA